MAIAYYVPDQSKLVDQQPKKPKLVKNYKIPLNSFTLANNTCWELIAQVFCYALRYHQLSAGNGVLQISIEYIPPPSPQLQPHHDVDHSGKN